MTTGPQREHMADKGYLEAHHLQDMFSMLRENDLIGSDSHMAHFFLSETFVPYRGLVPGLRP